MTIISTFVHSIPTILMDILWNKTFCIFQLQVKYNGDPVSVIVNEIYSDLNVRHGDIAYLRDRAILTPLN